MRYRVCLALCRIAAFQFQKVRLWGKTTTATYYLSKFQFQKVRLWVKTIWRGSDDVIRFNSKRCDYEKVYGIPKRDIVAVSIPKGAIMSTDEYSFTDVQRECFNSKRCDYEYEHAQAAVESYCFNSKRCDYEKEAWANLYADKCFNSKRCDYERLLPNQYFCAESFNSKRCDYELTGFSFINNFIKVSIPKGAIMRSIVRYFLIIFSVSIPKGAIMSASKKQRREPKFVGFNSKRCDYEWLKCQEKREINVSFNSKRCDYELMKLDKNERYIWFQFQKVRLWVKFFSPSL